MPFRAAFKAAIAILAGAFFATDRGSAEPHVVINEISASNRSILADETGEYPDWLELVNTGDSPADLTGWGLSDDHRKPFKWTFTPARIDPGQYLTVFASGKDRQPIDLPPLDPAGVSGRAAWFRADAVGTNDVNQIRRSGTALYVRRWLDQSGKGTHATSTVDAAQPLWISSGVDGRPALRFDGGNDQLLLGRIPATNDFCILVVARPTRQQENDPESASGVGGVSGQRYLFGAQHGGDFNGGAGLSLGTNGVSVYEHGSGYMPALAAYAGSLSPGYHIVTVNYVDKRPSLFLDGALAREGLLSPRSQVTAPIEIGAGSYGAFGGDVTEIVIFSRSLAPEERRGVETFLAAKYGIAQSQPRHTNFQLDSDGEELTLTRADGTQADAVVFPSMPTDVSYGRQPDAGPGWFYFAAPTPGSTNSGPAATEFIPSPTFSVPGGFHSHAVELVMAVAAPGAEIRYTTDGSEPTPASTLYSSPVVLKSRAGTPNQISAIPTVPGGFGANGEVFKCWPIRARSFKPGALPSEIVTRTFWIDARGRNRYTVPVVSLVTDRRNFFAPDIGIYIPGDNLNYNQRGPEWERPVHVELCETDNEIAVSQEADAKIHGNTSQGFPIKGLDLDATGLRGRKPFKYRFFPDRTRAEFEHILLRPTGHDQPYAFMRDELMQSLAGETGAESQAARLCVVFINGEYWGLHYLKEKEDAAFVAYYANRADDEIDYLEGYAAAKAGSTRHYEEMLQFIQAHDLSIPAEFDEVGLRIEVPSYIDYKAFEIFFYRWDIGNHRLWRPQAPDGRWRWLQFDNDVGWGGFAAIQPAWQFNMLAADLATDGSLNGHNNETTTFLLRRLVANAQFRRDFINRSADLMNTILAVPNATNRINGFARQLEPEMAEHIRRWRSPASVAEWRGNVEYLRNFANNRATFVRQHFQQRFGLGAAIQVQIAVADTNSGRIRLNSLVLSNSTASPFIGRYFSGHPLPIIAEAAPGYRFVGWQGLEDTVSANQVVRPQHALDIIARFEPDPAARPHLAIRLDADSSEWALEIRGSANTTMALESSEEWGPWVLVGNLSLDASGRTGFRLPLASNTEVRCFRLRVR